MLGAFRQRDGQGGQALALGNLRGEGLFVRLPGRIV